MSKRFDNKKLLYVFGVLLVILLLTVFVRIPRQNSTLKGAIIKIDTTAVSKIAIMPGNRKDDDFEFIKSGKQWTVRQGSIISRTIPGAVTNIFNDLLSSKPQSLAAKSKSRWKEYNLTDSLATCIRFENGKGKELGKVYIGKFSYNQPSSTAPSYYGGNNVEGISYVRTGRGDEVYAVDGFLALSFAGKFSDWRDRRLTRCKKDDITKVTYKFPGDSSYTLSKTGRIWMAGSNRADSVTVQNFLSELQYLDGRDFKDGYTPPPMPDYQVTVEGNNLLKFTVDCYIENGTGNYVISSDQNPGVFYSSDKNGDFKRIFRSEKSFLKKQETKKRK